MVLADQQEGPACCCRHMRAFFAEKSQGGGAEGHVLLSVGGQPDFDYLLTMRVVDAPWTRFLDRFLFYCRVPREIDRFQGVQQGQVGRRNDGERPFARLLRVGDRGVVPSSCSMHAA